MQTPKDLYDALVAFYKPEEAEKVDITILRFVLYARKSTTSDERQERSISDQKKDCLDTAKRLGIPFEHITIVEEQESAKEPDIRPLFAAMVEDIKRGKYDAILTWHPDRLARNMADAGKVIDLRAVNYETPSPLSLKRTKNNPLLAGEARTTHQSHSWKQEMEPFKVRRSRTRGGRVDNWQGTQRRSVACW